MSHSFGTNDSQNGVTGLTVGPNSAGVIGRYQDARSHPISALLHPPPPPASGVMGIHHGFIESDGTDHGGAGVHGESSTGDGVWGIASALTKSGVFGWNASKQRGASPPGGSGVFGLTDAPGAAGVFGSNNSNATGVGVQGNG